MLKINYHTSVLLQETLKILNPQPGKTFIDTTLGHAGHTIEFLKKGAFVYGIETDPKNLKTATNRIKKLGLSKNFIPINNNFSNLEKIYKKNIKKHTCHCERSVAIPSGSPRLRQLADPRDDNCKDIDAIFFDLGLSSNQLKSKNRGFSFNDNQSLDMRLNPKTQTLTAEFIVNTYSFDQLYQIFTKIAQEKHSKILIKKIINARKKSPIKNAVELAQIIFNHYKKENLYSKAHPATKIFMALRIVVNQELKKLNSVLNQTLKILKTGNKVLIISFHSGEDRIVKQFIKKHSASNKIIKLTPKVIQASRKEIKQNPLSRSAKLRAFQIK
ncbi:16S rRNA (cytosine(1402)-N(4))-methyltransferase RsmH [Patescibacteria group bacterium]|nr:16S rRNA (cytosine(1402)-N(4))-methyltransferase RsmH [Patescibacteria group bacterium]